MAIPSSPPGTDAGVIRCLAGATVSLVSSRQPRWVDPDSRWLRLTFLLGTKLAEHGASLLGSVGNLPYEAALFAALRSGAQVTAVLPDAKAETRLVSLLAPGCLTQLAVKNLSGETAQRLQARDRQVIFEADLCIALSIRKGGAMQRLLLERLAAGATVWIAPLELGVERATGHGRLLEAGAVPIPEALLAPGAGQVSGSGVDGSGVPLEGVRRASSASSSPLQLLAPHLERWQVWREEDACTPSLFHYTRSCVGPWPGQPRWHYLQGLMDGGAAARRDVVATLAHILDEGGIRGSGRLIRGGHPMVSLTEASPLELAPLQRYQRHLLRWDFQPWGVAIDWEAAEGVGAKPVLYAPAKDFDDLNSDAQPFFQKHAPPGCDHSREREWRVPGTIDLNRLPRAAVRIVMAPGVQP